MHACVRAYVCVCMCVCVSVYEVTKFVHRQYKIHRQFLPFLLLYFCTRLGYGCIYIRHVLSVLVYSVWQHDIVIVL